MLMELYTLGHKGSLSWDALFFASTEGWKKDKPLGRLQEIRSDRVSRTEMRIRTSEIPQTLQSCKNHTRNQSMEEMVARWLVVSTVVSDNIKHHHLMEAKGNSPRRPRSREVAGRDTTVQVCWDGHIECLSTLQGYVCPDQVLGLFCPCSLPSCCPFRDPQLPDRPMPEVHRWVLEIRQNPFWKNLWVQCP